MMKSRPVIVFCGTWQIHLHGKNLTIDFKIFFADPRNIRLGFACDGFNPFRNMSNNYSIWHVILIPYNLPP